MSEKGYPWRDAELLRRMYWDKQMSPYDIAEELNCAARTIYTWLDKHDIEQRSHKESAILGKLRDRVPRFETQDSGYERWMTRHRYERWQCKVHRLLAVAEYGFDTVCDNHVHHKNGIRWDNRGENIEVLSEKEHSRLHFEERDDIGPEIGLIAQYGAEKVLGPDEAYGSKQAAAEAEARSDDS